VSLFSTIWDEILGRVETKVNAHTYHSWFRNTTLLSDGGPAGLQVQVPNQTVVDWLTRHYAGVIAEALTDCNFAAAVSSRLREFSPPIVTPRELATQLSGQSTLNAALLFGNERFGLPNEAVEKCNVLINIPANPDYSSLNLAQAVQVLSYECRMAATGDARPTTDIGFQGEAAGLAQIDGMYAHLEEALVAIEFLDSDNPKKLMPRLKRLFARTQLETEEVNILRGIAKQILQKQRP